MESITIPLMTIGARLEGLMAAREMLQTELAKHIGVTDQALSAIILGKTKTLKAETLVRLCSVLRCNPEWLLNGTGKPTVEQINNEEEARAIAICRELPPALRPVWLGAGEAMLKHS